MTRALVGVLVLNVAAAALMWSGLTPGAKGGVAYLSLVLVCAVIGAARTSTKTSLVSGTHGRELHFWCPGCDTTHAIRVDGANAWKWNADQERPTASPSLLSTSTDALGVERRCHGYLRDGRLEFLNDSTHALRGQTVELPDWPFQETDRA
jgi:hypothetical protein